MDPPTTTTMPPPPPSPVQEPGTLSFGIKSAAEVERDGQVGLALTGWASRYNETDQDGEVQQPGSLLDSVDTWLARERPPVWFEHGTDAALGPREIGWATKADFNAEGLFVEVFVPRDIWQRWTGPGAKAATQRFTQVYSDIKGGVIRGFSVGGHFTRMGKSLLKWAVTELTICRTPCLPSAQFMLGAKALSDEYGAVPTVIDPPQPPDLLAQVVALTERLDALDGQGLGTKAAVLKKDSDGLMHPASHYLWTPDKTKVNTWKLQVKHTDKDGYDRDLCGNVHAALTRGFRGNKVEGVPKAQLLAKLKRIYSAQGWDWPGSGGSGTGGKATDIALVALQDAHPQTYEQMATLLTTFAQGRKAGRRFSAETMAAVQRILNQIEALEEDIEQTFGVTDADDDAPADAAASSVAPGTTPLAVSQ